VISSLGTVGDASANELMADIRGRLPPDEQDQLAAFTAAKKALRAKYPDLLHWAPFPCLVAPR
jgi:anti-sigma factor RsiW